MRCKWLICLEFSPHATHRRAGRSMPPGWAANKPHAKCLWWSANNTAKTTNRNTDTEYPQFADPSSVNGMKRDVCADVPDESKPTERFRAVALHESASSPRKTGATSYAIDSEFTNASPRSPPRAYASSPHLSRSSPAIPPRIRFVSSGINAHFGHVTLMKDALHETDAYQRHAG
jgi:hypothetical protein